MATTRPFVLNTGSAISGTTQVGSLAVGNTAQVPAAPPAGEQWWMGPDEEIGYVIAHAVSPLTQATPVMTLASVGFNRTKNLNDAEFINLAKYVSKKFATPQTFATAALAKTWLDTNGFWNSYVASSVPTPVLYLDAGDPASYPGSGTAWTDTIGGKVFYFSYTPTYSSLDGGKLYFDGSYMAEASPSLSSLSNWTVAVWHYSYGATNQPVIWESYASSANVNYLLGNSGGSGFVAGFRDVGGVLRATGPSYQLTPFGWYYIVGTYDGATVKLYVNNVLIDSANQTAASVSSGGSIQLMGNSELGEYLEGSLATVGIYNTALTAGQISSIWNSTKSRFGL